MTETEKRRQAILELLETNAVHSQGELGKLLKMMGYRATQTTLSRDIAALKLAKTGGIYINPGVGASTGLAGKVRGRILRVTRGGPHLVVVHTHPGEAGLVGIAIDEQGWKEVAGTVAGDDTLFIACGKASDGDGILRHLERIQPDAFTKKGKKE